MQLSGLLEKLKGLFTPAFLISSLTPLFCFIFVNGAILAQFNRNINTWLSDWVKLDATPKTVVGAVAMLSVVIIGYLFSTLNLTLRQILEGDNLPNWFRSRLNHAETARFDALLEELTDVENLRRKLSDHGQSWMNELKAARDIGKQTKKNNYSEKAQAHTYLSALYRKRDRGQTITLKLLQQAITSLKQSLENNSADMAGGDNRRLLDQDHQKMGNLIDYAAARVEDDYIRLYNQKEFNFSRYRVAPTRMGNIAESIRSYALSRYGMNLDFFWTRFQKVLQGQEAFYKTLQDAKTQLDFTVSLFWLSVFTTVIWLVLMPFLSWTWIPLISVWIGGPAVARVSYELALQNYRSFADLLRSSLDLFRFELLSELKLSRPLDNQAEEQLWDKLTHRMTYGERVLLSYKSD
jgi:hypothetical protein